MINMGYVVLRKGEVVDIAKRVAKGASKMFHDERVYFRPKMCGICQRYIESATGVTDAVCSKPCKRISERKKEKNAQPAVEGTKTKNKVKARVENERLLDEPTQHSNKLH